LEALCHTLIEFLSPGKLKGKGVSQSELPRNTQLRTELSYY